MKLIPSQKLELKHQKLSVAVLTIGMFIASLYATYCVFTKREMLLENPRLWLVVISVYVVTVVCGLYYLILQRVYRKRRNSFWIAKNRDSIFWREEHPAASKGFAFASLLTQASIASRCQFRSAGCGYRGARSRIRTLRDDSAILKNRDSIFSGDVLRPPPKRGFLAGRTSRRQ